MTGQNWLRGRSLVYATPSKAPAQKPKRFNLWQMLKTALRRTCTALGAMLLITIILTVVASTKIVNEAAPKLSSQFIVVMELDSDIKERKSPVGFLSDQTKLSLPDMILALDDAAKDPRVKGFILRVKGTHYSLAQLQELRAAVSRYVATGKPAKIYAPTYGDYGSGLTLYYLASAFPDIWMQPVGVVSVSGTRVEMPYAKKLLDRMGVKTQFFQRKEYKNAMENLTAEQMSEASRESTTSMIDDMMSQMKAGILQSRPKLAGKLDGLIDIGLLTDEEALTAGLIDRLDYRDVMLEEMKLAVDPNIESYWAHYYLGSKKREKQQQAMLHKKTRKKVALVYVSGAITDTADTENPYSMGGKSGAADRISDSIYDAAKDDDIQAIVVRVDSPGGSPTASETIRRAIVWAKTKQNKPVYVSMGGVAASGGYWMSVDADQIYALPGTLTGSIGVVGGKFELSELWKKLDINWEAIGTSQNGGMWSMNQGFTPEEQARYEAMLDKVYEQFVTRVAQGRKLTQAQSEEIARGRVWTGNQAKNLGLVDKLGGMDMALDDLAKTLGLSSREDLALVEMPKPETPFEQLMALVEGEGGVMIGGWMKSVVTNLFHAQPDAMDSLVYETMQVR